MAQGSPSDVFLQAALALGPALARDVIARSRLDGPAADLALKELLDNGQFIDLEDVLIAASQWSALNETVGNSLVVYHQTYPLRRGMPREAE